MNFFIKSIQAFTVRGFGAAAGFFMSLAVTNLTDASQAGVFFFALAMTQLGGGILTLGSPNALLKVVGADYGTRWERINYQVSFVLKWVFIFSIVVFTLFTLFPTYISHLLGMREISSFLTWVSCGIFFFALVQIFASMLQGKQQIILASSVQNVIAPIGFIATLGIATWCGGMQSGYSLFLIYLLSLFLATSIGGIVWFKTSGAKFNFITKHTADLKESISALFISMLMSMCTMYAGQFAIAKFLSSIELAYFSAALRTATLASFVLIAVNLVVAPKFAKAFAKGQSTEVDKLSLQSSRLMVLMATPVLGLMLLFPDMLMGLFGEEYKKAAPILQVLAVGQFINVITGSVGYLLNMTGHEKDMRNVVLFSGPLAIALAFGLTSQFGLTGAAYATAISVATQNLLAVWMVKKRLGFNTLNIFRKIA